MLVAPENGCRIPESPIPGSTIQDWNALGGVLCSNILARQIPTVTATTVDGSEIPNNQPPFGWFLKPCK